MPQLAARRICWFPTQEKEEAGSQNKKDQAISRGLIERTQVGTLSPRSTDGNVSRESRIVRDRQGEGGNMTVTRKRSYLVL